MANEVRVHTSVKDDVSQPLTTIRDRIKGIGTEAKSSILTGVGLGAGVSAFGAIEHAVEGAVGLLSESINKAEENEVSYTKLTAALKANVIGWNGNIDAIKAANEAGAKLGFTDNEMADSLALLVAATHNVAQAEQVRATAMDLARFKGISLQEASEALTRVEGGSFRILKSLGIQLKDNATAQDALTAVQKVAGGQAEAYGRTTAGAYAKLNAAWEQAQETLGAKLLPALTALANFLADIIPPAADAATKAMGTLGDAADGLGKLLGLLGPSDAQLKQLGADAKTSGGQFDLFNSILDALNPGHRLLGLVDEANKSAKTATEWGQSWDAAAHDADKATGEVVPKVGQNATDAVAAYTQGLSHVIVAGKTVISHMTRAQNIEFLKGKADAAKLGADTASSYADGLESGYDDVFSAAKDIRDALAHPLSTTKRIAKLEGSLTGDEYQKALHSKDPIIRERAHAWRLKVRAEIAALRAEAASYGASTGTSYANGLAGSLNDQYWKVHASLEKYKDLLQGHSPPKAGPLKGLTAEPIGRWWAETFVKGLGVDRVHAALSGIVSGLTPDRSSFGGMVPAMAMASGMAGGGLTINISGVSVLTPGSAEALANHIGPTLTRWQQRKGVLAR